MYCLTNLFKQTKTLETGLELWIYYAHFWFLNHIIHISYIITQIKNFNSVTKTWQVKISILQLQIELNLQIVMDFNKNNETIYL